MISETSRGFTYPWMLETEPQSQPQPRHVSEEVAAASVESDVDTVEEADPN